MGTMQAKDGHEDEALQLEVGPEDGGGGGGEGDEDAVDPKDHDGADAHHDDGGQADAVNVLDHGPVPADLFQGQVDLGVALQVHDQGGHGSHALAGHGGHGGPGHPQLGRAEEAEDEDGVQDDVDEGPQDLGAHGQVGAAGGLEQPLKGELAEQADGAAQADLAVGGAGGDDLLYVGLQQEEGVGEEDAQHTEDHEGT